MGEKEVERGFHSVSHFSLISHLLFKFMVIRIIYLSKRRFITPFYNTAGLPTFCQPFPVQMYRNMVHLP